MEDQSDGQLIGKWELDCMTSVLSTAAANATSAASSPSSTATITAGAAAARWTPCHTDNGVGHKRIVNVVLSDGGGGNAREAAGNTSGVLTAMRLRVLSHFAMPGQVARIRSLAVYDWASKATCV